jgi:SNF2 family DNA or RNA helicase
VLKKICDHPHLLFPNNNTNANNTNDYLQLCGSDTGFKDILFCNNGDNVTGSSSLGTGEQSVDQLMRLSGKLIFAFSLLAQLRSQGHRTLIFSQSTRMLDFIQKILAEKDYKFLRVDGTVVCMYFIGQLSILLVTCLLLLWCLAGK